MEAAATPGLFMILLGCTPEGRFTEQHDIFFGIGNNLKELLPDMIAFWPEAKGKIHIDAWRAVTNVDGHKIEVVPKDQSNNGNSKGLFFLNLGGYKPDEFAELHYMMLVAAETKAAAIKAGKETAFYKHMGFKGATSHIDDKFGVDIDDIFEIDDILNPKWKEKYTIRITQTEGLATDEMHLGYIPSKNLK